VSYYEGGSFIAWRLSEIENVALNAIHGDRLFHRKMYFEVMDEQVG
jgi:hypothetical protein